MKFKKYFFIGIGGVSMSALALILKNLGFIVEGSDLYESCYTKKLKENGITVHLNHSPKNIKDADVVVYNSAIDDSNIELSYAKSKSLKILSRAELLKSISNRYKNVIAISGAHGKTSTTAMITEVFIKAKLMPTAHLGGVLKSYNSNIIIGGNDFFITEACEYKDNFLTLKPTVAVILNVEPEHLDYFKNFENVCKSFEKFALQSKQVVSNDNLNLKFNPTIVFGDRGYHARNIKLLKSGKYKFDCYFNEKKLFNVKMNVIGKYNISNALACIAVCKLFNIKNNIIKKSLESFKGVKRRYEIKKTKPLIVHDYAHHPSEIKSVIDATRKNVKGRLIVAFQPHTYSRTKALLNEFQTAFDDCDEVYIIKTYSAREKVIKGGTAKDLYSKLVKRKYITKYFSNFQKCYDYISNNLKKKDVLLILGAGDIETLSDKFDKKSIK